MDWIPECADCPYCVICPPVGYDDMAEAECHADVCRVREPDLDKLTSQSVEAEQIRRHAEPRPVHSRMREWVTHMLQYGGNFPRRF